MAKKTNKMTTIEIFDTFVPIVCICWVLVFAYISLFTESSLLAMITVMPVFFIYGLYLIGSAIYCYKEKEILEAMGRDTYEVQRRHRKNPPKLSNTKLIIAGCCIIGAILLCIFL